MAAYARQVRVARLTAFLLLAALTLALAGCSSSKEAATPDGSPTTSLSAAAPTTTGRPASADPFCNFVRTYNERFGRINPGAVTDPQQFRTVMSDAATAINDAAKAAPASIRSDVAVMSQAVQRLLDAFQRVNFDVTRIPVTAFTDLQAPEFIAAGQRLDAYSRQNCT